MGMMAALAESTMAAADFSAWTDSTQVKLNTTSSGARVAVNVANFPVLVSLTAVDLVFSEAKSDGSDLRFADASGTALPFELERFDPVNKVAEAWVLLPTVTGNSAEQWFKMYWGNPSALPASSGPAVFHAGTDFTGVWHLGEDGSTATSAYKDASSYGNHGTGLGMTSTSDVAGRIATGANFSPAANQGIHVAHHASLHPDGNLTVEAWVRSTTQGPFKRFVGKPFSAVAAPWNEYSLEADSTGAKVTFSLTLADVESGVIGTTVMANGTWYHVVGTYDGSMQRIYVNGALENSVARTGAISNYSQVVSIGKYGLDNVSNFDGAVDEARISKAARGADWIKLAYANQKPNQTLVGFQRFTECQTQFAMPADITVNEGSPIKLSAKAECATGYSWSVVSGPAPRMLDPAVKILEADMPRVVGDQVVIYRFSADFGGTAQTGDVKVTIKETIPEPLFTLPALETWTGAAPLKVSPTLTNAAEIAGSSAPTLRYAWSLAGIAVDSTQDKDSLTLSNPLQSGSLTIRLCLDNNGPPTCRETTVNVSPTVGIRARPAIGTFSKRHGIDRDAKGRARPVISRRRVH